MKKLLSLLLSLVLVGQFIFISVSADTRPALEDRGAMGLALALRPESGDLCRHPSANLFQSRIRYDQA